MDGGVKPPSGRDAANATDSNGAQKFFDGFGDLKQICLMFRRAKHVSKSENPFLSAACRLAEGCVGLCRDAPLSWDELSAAEACRPGINSAQDVCSGSGGVSGGGRGEHV